LGFIFVALLLKEKYITSVANGIAIALSLNNRAIPKKHTDNNKYNNFEFFL